MKKISFIILGFVIGALVTYLFCPRQIKEEQPASNTALKSKVVKPKGVITVAQAKKLNANWTLHRKAAVDSAAKEQGRDVDDRSTWWSLDDIENYITYAKGQSDSLGYTMTGIRVYLGVYGDNYGQTKKNLTTMYMVPTGDKSQSKASFSPFNFVRRNTDILAPPLNDGTGSDGGYPN